MRKFLILLFCTGLLIKFSSCQQPQIKIDNGAYTVDSKAKKQIDKKVKSANGITMSYLDFKMYENGIIVEDTYSKGKGFDECMMMATLEGDTINIFGFLGMFAGFGYEIYLFKDSCIIRHFIKSDEEIYKLHKNDSLQFGISVPCKTYKLTLVNKPTFKKGEILEGIVELTSDEYFEVANGVEKKYKITLTGYFKTDPLVIGN